IFSLLLLAAVKQQRAAAENAAAEVEARERRHRLRKLLDHEHDRDEVPSGAAVFFRRRQTEPTRRAEFAVEIERAFSRLVVAPDDSGRALLLDELADAGDHHLLLFVEFKIHCL